MKTFKWNESEFKTVQEDLANYLESQKFEVVDFGDYKKENYIWDVSSEFTSPKVLIKNRQNTGTSSGDLLRFHFEENEASPALINPSYILLDEINKTINIIFMRSQDAEKGGGTVYQKMGSFAFVRSDYLERYEKIYDYDINVTVILNEHFKQPNYKKFIRHLKQNSINVWINEIKI